MTNLQYLSCSISDGSCFCKPSPQVSVPFSMCSCAFVPGEPTLTINFWSHTSERTVKHLPSIRLKLQVMKTGLLGEQKNKSVHGQKLVASHIIIFTYVVCSVCMPFTCFLFCQVLHEDISFIWLFYIFNAPQCFLHYIIFFIANNKVKSVVYLQSDEFVPAQCHAVCSTFLSWRKQK